MKIHNVIEDVVIKFVDDILSQKKNICTCEQCKLDIICYVLNKTSPMYVVSSRGIIHSENNKRENTQYDIDILTLVKVAIDVISKTPRHVCEENMINAIENSIVPDDPFIYIFPTIVGRVINSLTLNPQENSDIYLNTGNSEILAKMFNNRWNNPVKLVDKMDGTFSFWPLPVKAEKEGVEKVFDFNIEIKTNNSTNLRKSFEISLVSTANSDNINLSDKLYRLDDIYINPED